VSHSAGRWERIKQLFQAALDRPPAERSAFLHDACGGDRDLRVEVESLLDAHASAGSFAARPALDELDASAAARIEGAALTRDALESQQLPAVTLRTGARLGPYEILSWVGSGGMGEVYRARDSRLNRDVALKVLPEATAANPERRHRFEREAQAIAALNHPNIVAIHSVEQAGGVHFLTMELVEGRTLAELIARRGLGIDQILELAIPLADAVSSAHERGITHRDLKPANIMVSREGRVKVLDFGLAKLRDAELAAAGTAVPTGPLTDEGRIIGTVAYMSPEQADGKTIDHRSDIFSLGIVLFELATGERPFRGDSNLSVLSSIMKDTPKSVTEANQTLPREFGRIVRHCLAKDPSRRYQTAADLRNELEELKQDLGSEIAAGDGRLLPSRRRNTWALGGAIAATLVLLSAIGSYVVIAPKRAAEAPPVRVEARFERLTTEPGIEQFPSLSPDGTWVVYSKGGDIYLRSVGEQPPFNLTKDAMAAATQPAFSPDGDQIVFRSDRLGGGIWVMGRTGGSPKRLTDGGFNPAWSPDGKQIVFATGSIDNDPWIRAAKSELWAVTIATGEKRRITSVNAWQPSWSPHGDRIAYWTDGGQPGRNVDIYTVPASGGDAVQVTNDAGLPWNPVWSPDGKYLYFSSNRSGSFNLWRVPIHERSGKPLGPLEPFTTPSSFVAHPSLSADGRHIAYASIDITANIQKAAFDAASGTVTGDPEPVTSGSKTWNVQDPSPDNQMLAFISTREQEDLFVSRTDGSGLTRLTNDPANDRNPRWAPDGKRIAFQSTRSGSSQIWTISSDGSDLRQLTEYSGNLSWPAWSTDGRWMAANDLPRNMVLIFDPNKPWKAQVPQEIMPPSGRFSSQSWSPDGQWLAGFEPTHTLGVVVFSLKSRTYQRLTDFYGGPVVWLNDSRRLLFSSLRRDISLIDIRTKKVQVVLSFPGENVGSASLSRDNSTIYFLRGKAEADIWMATLK
jgi:Tol biopolymer transport system component